MRLRPLLLVLVLALSLGLLAGCGGDGNTEKTGETADSSTDVDKLLEETFTGSKDIKSGKLDLRLDGESGGQAFAVKLGGPFESTGTGKLPKLDISASLEGGGQNFDAGVTFTDDKGFVSFAGTDYAIDDTTFKALKAGFEEQASKEGSDQSLATLGVNPSKWLSNPRNAGEAKVGDTDTIKITGDVDVPKMLDDVNAALAKLRAVGGASAAGLPDQLSEQDKQQATEAIKDLNVEIYTGAEDKIMRRLVVAMKLEVPAASGSAQSADVKFDLQLLDLNESQEFSAPENAKPFKDLLAQLQQLGLGGLGGLGGTGSGSGSSGGGTSQQNLEKYSQCISEASGNDEIRKCADLLTP